MFLIGARLLGVGIAALWILQWIVMRRSPGGFLRGGAPEGTVAAIYNFLAMVMIMLLVPAVAVALITGNLKPIEVTRIPINEGSVRNALEVIGFVLWLSGHGLVSWGRVTLGRSFQMGGVAPRSEDTLVTNGPYRYVRHPMYTALLSLMIGVGLLIQSLVVLVLATTLLVMILLLIPIEEKQLSESYGESYERYQQGTCALFPMIF